MFTQCAPKTGAISISNEHCPNVAPEDPACLIQSSTSASRGSVLHWMPRVPPGWGLSFVAGISNFVSSHILFSSSHAPSSVETGGGRPISTPRTPSSQCLRGCGVGGRPVAHPAKLRLQRKHNCPHRCRLHAFKGDLCYSTLHFGDACGILHLTRTNVFISVGEATEVDAP